MSFQHETTAFRPAPIPVRKSMASGKPRSKHLAPLDPEDLSRRLYIVLAEREAYAERKRRAWAEAERRSKSAAFTDVKGGKSKSTTLPRERGRVDPAQSKHIQDKGLTISTVRPDSQGHDDHTRNYRHIPKVAASQFARTTTVDPPEEKTLVHRLSRAAMRFHKDGLQRGDPPAPDTAPFETAKALKKAQKQREREYDRNQFQYPPTLDSSIESDDRLFRLAQRHTFEPHLVTKHKELGIEQPDARLSIGSVLRPRMSSEMQAAAAHLERQESCDQGRSSTGWEHRVDWTQSDERRVQLGDSEPAQLRKTESRWTLRGRLSSLSKTKSVAGFHVEDVQSPPEEAAKSPKSLRSPKSGFFSRFKR